MNVFITIALICLCVPILLCFPEQLSHLPYRFWRLFLNPYTSTCIALGWTAEHSLTLSCPSPSRGRHHKTINVVEYFPLVVVVSQNTLKRQCDTSVAKLLRITGMWLPEIVISATTTCRHFQKKTIDKFWQHQDILYDNLPNALTLGIRNFVQ